MRRRRAGRRPAGESPLSPPLGFWRRLLGPFYALVIAVLGAVVLLSVGLAVRYLLITSPDQAAEARAPRITDTAFERSAVAVCKQYVTVFNTETTLSKQPTQVESGQFLDSIATSFDRMVTELRAIPTAPASAAAVQGWLQQWEAYDTFGHRYAAAVKIGAERDMIKNDAAYIGQLRRDRNGFANANHMGTCAFN